MNDFSNMTIIKRKRYLGLLYFAGSIICLILCCLPTFDNAVDLCRKIICMGGIIVSSFCAIKFFPWIVFPEVLFAYNDECFYIKEYDNFIKWNDVSEVQVYQTIAKYGAFFQPIKSPPILVLKLHNEQKFINEISTEASLLYKKRKNTYGYGICIALWASGIKFNSLLEFFLSRCTNLTTPFCKNYYK